MGTRLWRVFVRLTPDTGVGARPAAPRMPGRSGAAYASFNDSSEALPPTAVVLTEVVRSLAKRSK